jgi:hypothetical protein
MLRIPLEKSDTFSYFAVFPAHFFEFRCATCLKDREILVQFCYREKLLLHMFPASKAYAKYTAIPFHSEKFTGYFTLILVYLTYSLLPGIDVVGIFHIPTTGVIICQMKKTVLCSPSEGWRTSESLVSLVRYGSTGKYLQRCFYGSMQ